MTTSLQGPASAATPTSPTPNLGSDQKLHQLSRSTQWLRLLHMNRVARGRFVSRVDSPEFFLHSHGKTDPLAELLATLKAFWGKHGSSDEQQLGALKQSPYCAFPARLRFLEESLQVTFPAQNCENLDEWRKGLNARSVALVFSSAFAGSAGSLFGHTFLKFSGETLAEKEGVTEFQSQELLDYSVSYAANTGTVNPFTYFFYGVGGGFHGIFETAPFYLKVREYNHTEGRDLWIYDLNLSESEVHILVSHLWELATVGGFYYYFFDENCASILVQMIEVAKPEWDISSRFFYAVLPGETLRQLQSIPGALRNPRQRVSRSKVLQQAQNQLSKDEFSLYERALSQLKIESNENFSRNVLLALVNHSEWSKAKQKGLLSPKERQLRREALFALARTPPPQGTPPSRQTPTRPPQRLSDPSQAHAAAYVQTGVRWSPSSAQENRSNWEGLIGLRGGYHSLLDRQTGSTAGLEIEYLDVLLRTDLQHGQLTLDQFNVLRLTALNPEHTVSFQPSYRASLSYDAPSAKQARILTAVGAGATVSILSKQALAALLLTPQLEVPVGGARSGAQPSGSIALEAQVVGEVPPLPGLRRPLGRARLHGSFASTGQFSSLVEHKILLSDGLSLATQVHSPELAVVGLRSQNNSKSSKRTLSVQWALQQEF